MGRPEKSKERKMNPPVHGLFPIGRSGGNQRDLIKAAFSRKEPFVEVVTKKCSKCNEITYENICPRCKVRTSKAMICSKCNIEIHDDMCKCCGAQAKFFSKKHINLSSK